MTMRLLFASARERFLAYAERAIPPGIADVQTIHRTRAAIAQTWLGIGFTAVFGALYGVCGSPWSGGAILLITAGLVIVPYALRQRISLVVIGNALVGLTWIATFIVASRSGGFTSPAIVWGFLFPLATYAVCGRMSAVVWSVLSGMQIGIFFVADLAGVTFAQDFSSRVLSVLRVSGYAGVLATTIVLLSVIEAARRAAFDAIDAENRTRERTRILNDMHDGVGSQLLGLVVQLRGGAVESPKMISALENCIDDLRLIVASLDTVEHEFDIALGELRARFEPRCEAARIELRWDASAVDSIPAGSSCIMHVLRAIQEMLTNAIRHSATTRIDVTVATEKLDEEFVLVVVRDFGCGLPTESRPHTGRGLKSLRARAHKLRGQFEVAAANPGTVARLRFPKVQHGS